MKVETLQLPHNLDAERLVLGGLMINNKHFAVVEGILEPRDFLLQKHRIIFTRVMDLRKRGQPVDRMTVANELMRFNELEAVDGLSYLVSLDDAMPAVPSIESYVKIVLEKSYLRVLVHGGQRLIQLASEQQTTPEELCRNFGKLLTKVELKAGGKEPHRTPGEIMLAHPGGINAFLTNAITQGRSWGFPQIDDLTLGLQSGCQYVLAGTTGSGKSALAANSAVHLAKNGYPIQYFSFEMTKEQLLARILCAEAQVPLKGFIQGWLNSEQRKKITDAVAVLHDIPLYIDDESDVGIIELLSRLKRAVMEKSVVGCVVDYLGLVNWRADTKLGLRTQYDGVTFTSRALKMAARRLNIFSIVLAQLTKGDNKNQGKKPVLDDLRDSGAIQQDADAVAFTYREEIFHPGRADLKGKAEVILRKVRMGNLGTAHLEFQGKYTRFVDNGPPDPVDEEK